MLRYITICGGVLIFLLTAINLARMPELSATPAVAQDAEPTNQIQKFGQDGWEDYHGDFNEYEISGGRLYEGANSAGEEWFEWTRSRKRYRVRKDDLTPGMKRILQKATDHERPVIIEGDDNGKLEEVVGKGK